MKNLEANIKLKYFFRDENNFKDFDEIVFINPEHLELAIIEKKLKSKLIDFEYFYPNEWNIKPFYFHNSETNNFWYEFEGVEETYKNPTSDLTIATFIDNITRD